EPFWMPLARAGRRVRVYDVPLARLSPHPNCVQVVEWGGHDRIYGKRSSPAEALDALARDVGDHAMRAECDDYAKCGERQQLFDDLLRGAEQRTRATRHTIEQGDWDLVVSVFSEAHCAGHNLWARRELLESVYGAVDRSLGEILAALPPDTTVVV